MGTPGDKNKISEVVSSISEQSNNEKGDESITTPTSASTSTILETTLSEMTVITELPHFDTFIDYNLPSSLSQNTIIKVEPTLEQAHIEDYFTQSKYYPTTSDSLQPLCPVLPDVKQGKEPDTFLNLDQPGPSGLQMHKHKTVSEKKVSTRKKNQSSPKKLYLCDICQKTFQNAAKLTKHQQLHGGSSPFKCEECKKTFTTKFKLLRHTLIHSDRKQFSCTVCERTFHRKDHLKNHIKVHSPSKTLYICEKPNCRKEYTSHLSYKKHLALHAAEEGSLECQICSKVFATKDDILYHLKIHAGSRTVKNPNEKKYTCDHCDRKFFTRKDVRRHLVVHTGMRDFLCQYCPQRFGRKDHLVRHIKKSHKDHIPTTSESIPDTVAIKTEKSESSIKSEISEISESSMSNPEYNVTYLDTLFSQNYEPLALLQNTDSVEFLPHTTTQGELKDLGSEVLEAIGETSQFSSENLPSTSLLEPDINDPELLRLLQPDNMPLPGFSQTFQSPPQQQPPPQQPPPS